jgi:disulfide bond formation protein DsbB
MTALAIPTGSSWRHAPLVLLLGSGGLLLGALFFQYVLDLRPCPLCMLQRYPHIAVVVLAAIAMAMHPGVPRRWILALIGVALLITAGIGVFHAGVEQKWWQGLAMCEGGGTKLSLSADDLTRNLSTRPAPRCDQIVWSLFGLTMAAWNAIFSTALAAFAFTAALRRGR